MARVASNSIHGMGPKQNGGISVHPGSVPADAAKMQPVTVNPVTVYGLRIARNTIDNSNTPSYGAITIVPAQGSKGSVPYYLKSSIIFRNAITMVPIGIDIPEPLTWSSVVANNTFVGVAVPVVDLGTMTTWVP